MAIIIKEMRVRTVVEKKIVTDTEIPEEICRKIREQVLKELTAQSSRHTDLRRKKER